MNQESYNSGYSDGRSRGRRESGGESGGGGLDIVVMIAFFSRTVYLILNWLVPVEKRFEQIADHNIIIAIIISIFVTVWSWSNKTIAFMLLLLSWPAVIHLYYFGEKQMWISAGGVLIFFQSLYFLRLKYIK